MPKQKVDKYISYEYNSIESTESIEFVENYLSNFHFQSYSNWYPTNSIEFVEDYLY